MRFRSRRAVAALLVSAIGAVAVSGIATADSPPVPDFFWPYGLIQVNGADVSPQVQPLIAFVNGRACGIAQTQVATAADGTPASDVGHTVYVIDVLADGSGAGDRPGCGRPNQPVTLYLPQSGLVAAQQPLFQQGSERVDLNMSTHLVYHGASAAVASDGSN